MTSIHDDDPLGWDGEPLDDRPPAPRCEYLCGLGLGQQSDSSAFVVVRKIPMGRNDRGYEIGMFEVPYIERFPLGMPYPRIVKSVVALMNRPELSPRPRSDWTTHRITGRPVLTSEAVPRAEVVTARPMLCLDATGLGRPCVDMFRDAGLRDLVAIVFTAGQAITSRGFGEYNVAKQHLVAAVRYVLNDGRLRIARETLYADVMLHELQAFKIKVTHAAHETYGAEGGSHDELVTALCMPIWYAGQIYSAGCV
jgi:hypothetical protein